MNYCSEKNRKKRCRREPKCQHLNCIRNAQENLSICGLTLKDTYHGSVAELNLSENGYDAGFIKDEYDCNLKKCECAYFDQLKIGKSKFQ